MYSKNSLLDRYFNHSSVQAFRYCERDSVYQPATTISAVTGKVNINEDLLRGQK